jgi:hypothetical protein
LRDAFGIDHGFIRRDIEMQVLFVDTPEGTQIGPERGARSLAAVAVDLAPTLTIVIPGPFAHPVGHRGMARMATAITLPLIRIEPRATGGTLSAIRSRQVCRFAWSQTHQRCSPVSREMILMMGGRSFA